MFLLIAKLRGFLLNTRVYVQGSQATHQKAMEWECPV